MWTTNYFHLKVPIMFDEIAQGTSPITLLFSTSPRLTAYVESLMDSSDSIRIDPQLLTGLHDIPQYGYMLPLRASHWVHTIHLSKGTKWQGLPKVLESIPKNGRLKLLIVTDTPQIFFRLLEHSPNLTSYWGAYLPKPDLRYLLDDAFPKSVTTFLTENYASDIESLFTLLDHPQGITTPAQVIERVGVAAGTVQGYIFKLLSPSSASNLRLIVKKRLQQGYQLQSSYSSPQAFFKALTKFLTQLLELRELYLAGLEPPSKARPYILKKLSTIPLATLLKLRLLLDSGKLESVVYGMYADSPTIDSIILGE